MDGSLQTETSTPNTAYSAGGGEDVTTFTKLAVRATRDRETCELVVDVGASPGGAFQRKEALHIQEGSSGECVDGSIFFAELIFKDEHGGSRWHVRQPFPDASPFKYVAITFQGQLVCIAPVEDV